MTLTGDIQHPLDRSPSGRAGAEQRIGKGYTLVIPTYNRAVLLKRLLQYYWQSGWPQNLLVLDSSKTEIAEQNAKALGALRESVRHVVFPDITPMAAKLAQGLALVETPYVSFCADDDLVLEAGITEAMAFLSEHADYVAAHGLYLNFQQHGCEVRLMREYAGPGNEAQHPGARIFRLLQKYESLFYGVFRTADLRQILSAVSMLPTLHYQELFQSVAVLIKGKVHRFPRLYAMRQSCEPAQPERTKWQTYYWFAEDPAEVLSEYRDYREHLWRFYEAHGPSPLLDKAAFSKVLDLAHSIYFAASCPPQYFHSVLQPLWPQDPYAKLDRIDLFEKLRNPAKHLDLSAKKRGLRIAGQTFDSDQLLRGVRYAFEAALAWPALMRLNRKVARTCRLPWRCRLALELGWLPRSKNFRESYLELCRYLDQPG